MTLALDEESSEAPAKVNEAGSPFAALKNRDFRLVWIGAFLSTTGTWMQTIAQAWVVLELTDSPFYLGLDAFLATLPMILFSLIGGVIADRMDRKRLLMLSQVLQMSFAAILAILIATGVVEVWHILILSFCTGTVQAFGGPAYQAILPLLVGRKMVPNAVALNSMQFNLARMIGPSLAGISLATLGAAWCFALNAVSFLAVLITLTLVHQSFKPDSKKTTSIGFDLREGLHFVRDNRALLYLTMLSFATTFLGIPLVTMMPVVAEKVFEVGASGYSFLMTLSGAGSVAGAIVVATYASLKRRGTWVIASQTLFAVFLLAFAFSESFWLTSVLTFLTGITLMGVITLSASLVQLVATEAIRGRVLSIFMLAFRGGMPLGNITAGWVTERYDVTLALGVNAILLLVVSMVFLATRRTLDAAASH